MKTEDQKFKIHQQHPRTYYIDADNQLTISYLKKYWTKSDAFCDMEMNGPLGSDLMEHYQHSVIWHYTHTKDCWVWYQKKVLTAKSLLIILNNLPEDKKDYIINASIDGNLNIYSRKYTIKSTKIEITKADIDDRNKVISLMDK